MFNARHVSHASRGVFAIGRTLRYVQATQAHWLQSAPPPAV